MLKIPLFNISILLVFILILLAAASVVFLLGAAFFGWFASKKRFFQIYSGLCLFVSILGIALFPFFMGFLAPHMQEEITETEAALKNADVSELQPGQAERLSAYLRDNYNELTGEAVRKIGWSFLWDRKTEYSWWVVPGAFRSSLQDGRLSADEFEDIETHIDINRRTRGQVSR